MPRNRLMTTHRPRGFTLIEVMVTVAIVAILASVAMPAYRSYITRSRVPVSFDALSSYASRMEQAYQDTGRYDTTAAPNVCAPSLPSANNFTISCVISGGGQGFTATATGHSSMVGYAYTINNTGNRVTIAHPKGTNATCWTMKGGAQCDN